MMTTIDGLIAYLNAIPAAERARPILYQYVTKEMFHADFTDEAWEEICSENQDWFAEQTSLLAQSL